MKETIFSAVIHKQGEWYVAQCPEVGTASQGRTRDEALANLKEAAELYLEELGEVAALDQAGIFFRPVNDQDEELYTPAEVFGPARPGPHPARGAGQGRADPARVGRAHRSPAGPYLGDGERPPLHHPGHGPQAGPGPGCCRLSGIFVESGR